MFLTLLQRIVSLPKHSAIGLGCWPWKDERLIDGKSVTSASSILNGEKRPASPELLDFRQNPSQHDLTWPDSHFAISEYNWVEDHFIDLERLPTGDRLMARALSDFRNTWPDYANPEIPYETSFSLEVVITSLRQLVNDEPGFQWSKQNYYVVADYSTLRSDLKPEDHKRLAELDEAAFREALPSRAFIKYWFGKADKVGRNVATCECNAPCDQYRLTPSGLWTNRNDAQRILAMVRITIVLLLREKVFTEKEPSIFTIIP